MRYMASQSPNKTYEEKRNFRVSLAYVGKRFVYATTGK